MNKLIILLIIFTIIAILVFIYIIGLTKLKRYKEKMDRAENIIDQNLSKKLDLIIAINGSIKKVTGKKDYLKDYVSIRDLIITNLEKDMKLEEAVKLINDLANDYEELNNDKEFVKNIKDIRETDEILVSAKSLFNQNALLNNKLIKTFPYNIIAKIANYKLKSYYTNNKTDDNDNF